MASESMPLVDNTRFRVHVERDEPRYGGPAVVTLTPDGFPTALVLRRHPQPDGTMLWRATWLVEPRALPAELVRELAAAAGMLLLEQQPGVR